MLPEARHAKEVARRSRVHEGEAQVGVFPNQLLGQHDHVFPIEHLHHLSAHEHVIVRLVRLGLDVTGHAA